MRLRGGFRVVGVGLVLLHVFAPVLGAEILFSSQKVLSTFLDAPECVVAADLDADGDFDLAGGSREEHLLSWFQNQGGFRFKQVSLDEDATHASQLFAVDLDGDTDVDLLTASAQNNCLMWHDNTGDFTPSFSRRIVSASAAAIGDVAAADFDNDGDQDVVAALTGDNALILYENQGAPAYGTWSPHTVAASVSGLKAVLAEDIDGDGDADIVTGTASEKPLVWYENEGKRSLSFIPHAVFHSALDVAHIASGDMNGDGDSDIVASLASENQIVWFENPGTPAVTSWDRYILAQVPGEPAGICVSDIDNDGDNDVIAALFDDDRVVCWENDGGSPAGFVEHILSEEVDKPYRVIVADLDSDGDRDVVSVSLADNKIAAYENLLIQAAPGKAEQAAGVKGSARSEDLSKYEKERSLGDSLFGPPNVIGEGHNGYPALAMGDFDRDGRRDIFVNRYGITCFWNSGATAMYVPVTFITDVIVPNSYVGPIACADLDRDGYTDIIQFARHGLVWYKQDLSNLRWNEYLIKPDSSSATPFATADIDRDGDSDVVVFNGVDGRILWIENRLSSNESWLDHGVFVPRSDASHIAIGDIDRDGDFDIATSAVSAPHIVWYENLTGDGTAWKQNIISNLMPGSRCVDIADIDQDGDLDVLSVAGIEHKVAWHENVDGRGCSWRTHIISTAVGGARWAYAGDLDLDGDVDVVAAAEEGGKISWFQNLDGNGLVWSEHLLTAEVLDAYCGSLADLDQDGDLDLVSIGLLDERYLWFENRLEERVKDRIIQPMTESATAEIEIIETAKKVRIEQADEVITAATEEEPSRIEPDQTPRGSLFSLGPTVTANAIDVARVCPADIDGDGDLDIVSTSRGDNRVSWYRNVGGNALDWQAHTITTNTEVCAGLACGDLDGDGDLDVIITEWESCAVTWFQNVNRDGFTWTRHILRTHIGNAIHVDTADFSGDGLVDVLAAGEAAAKPCVFVNSGATPLYFTEYRIRSPLYGYREFAIADMDSDGDLDLVVTTGQKNNNVYYFPNAGDGTVTADTHYALAESVPGAAGVCVADFDRDGFPDVAVASELGNKILWFKNNGAIPPQFSPQIVSSGIIGPRSLEACDVDEDGDIDMISTSFLEDRLYLHENDGSKSPRFDAVVIAERLDGAECAVTADMDGDGDRDILCASSRDNSIRVFFNRLREPGFAGWHPVVRGAVYILFAVALLALGYFSLRKICCLADQWRELQQLPEYTEQQMQHVWRSMNQASPLGVLVYDRALLVHDLNPAAERIFDVNRDQLIGLPLEILIPDEDMFNEAQFRKVFSGEPVVVRNATLRRRNGDLIFANLTASLWGGTQGKSEFAVAVIDDITEQRRLQDSLLDITEKEQRRIGQDLHDDVLQDLTAIAISGDLLTDKLEKHAPQEAMKLRDLVQQIDEAALKTRRLAKGLAPVDIEELGLVGALQDLALRTEKQHAVRCQFRGDTEFHVRRPEVQLNLYRIAQEAVVNAVRHARASGIVVRFAQDEGNAVLSVEDDGKGLSRERAEATGMGIHIMRYRANSIGAVLTINTVEDEGTTVICRIPKSAL